MKIVETLMTIYLISVNADDPNVRVLTSGDFDVTIEDHTHVLVMFHAPWCAHCQDLDPHYAEAAKLLAERGSRVIFAQVNVEEEKQLSEEHSISSLPTLLLFRKTEPISYSGDREAQGIVEWVDKKTSEGITAVTRPGELQYIVEEENMFVVGYFSNLDSEEYKVFESTYEDVDEVKFFLVSDPELMKEYHQQDGSIMVMKNFDEKLSYFKEEVTKENLKNFILREITPLVVDFSPENAGKIFDSDIRKHFILMSDKNAPRHHEMMKNLRVLARERKEDIIAIHCDTSEDHQDHDDVMEYFGITHEDCPTFALYDLEAMSKYKPATAQDVSIRSMRGFVKDYLDGKLQRFLRSAPLPADWNAGNVITLVASNFKEVAKDAAKNVFVFYYSPWSGQCKLFSEVWEKVATHFKRRLLGELYSDLVLAKFDVVANDPDDDKLVTEGLPALVMYNATRSRKPVIYHGKREFDSLVSFIETGEFEYEEYPPEEHDEDELEVFGDDGDFGHDEL